MKCQKCGSKNVVAWVNVEMYVDADDFASITKKVIAKKSTVIWGKDDRKTNFVCQDCMYATPTKRDWDLVKLDKLRELSDLYDDSYASTLEDAADAYEEMRKALKSILDEEEEKR